MLLSQYQKLLSSRARIKPVLLTCLSPSKLEVVFSVSRKIQSDTEWLRSLKVTIIIIIVIIFIMCDYSILDSMTNVF